MYWRDENELLTVRETLFRLNVENLKQLLALVRGSAQGRKAELVDQIATILEDLREVRSLYEGLDDLAKKAVQVATHDRQGVWNRGRFAARYGGMPDLFVPGRTRYSTVPTRLQLFFLHRAKLASDMRERLLTFVPEPSPLTLTGVDELPATVRPSEDEVVELRVRHTARAALLDLRAVLRLVEAGGVKVGEKTFRPSQASLKAIAAILSEGDYYEDVDRSEESHDPASDLTIRPFAWPMLLQAAGLASNTGSKLQLTPAGKKALTDPAHKVIRQVWGKWVKTTLLDEFNRVEAIKGQQSKGSLFAVAPRRQAVVEGLKHCPVGRWISVDELFRLFQATELNFEVARNDWKLYLSMLQYGNFGYGDNWECLQGRFTLAVLFEYAATLGLIDVAYISPECARSDFADHWGADDLSCLSRYDGLMYLRINPLGAWCLGLAHTYEPQTIPVEKTLKVLPNLDVVAVDRSPPPADVLFLERYAEKQSDAVWRLSRSNILAAVEQGAKVEELKEFLLSASKDPLPHTAVVFLDDLAQKASQLEDLGSARMIACKDSITAQMLTADRHLRGLCQLAGDRHLIFKASDETAVRKALRDLGYILPPPK